MKIKNYEKLIRIIIAVLSALLGAVGNNVAQTLSNF